MMGTKARIFAPIAVVSLEDLVPRTHFYRHLDHVLDLSFVRDLVKETYAHGGRPSIDPVVFFKLQLVMFFEDIRSEGSSSILGIAGLIVSTGSFFLMLKTHVLVTLRKSFPQI